MTETAPFCTLDEVPPEPRRSFHLHSSLLDRSAPSDLDGVIALEPPRARFESAAAAAYIKVPKRGTTSHPTQSEFWDARILLKSTIASRLHTAGLAEQAEALTACRTIPSHAVCGDCNRVRTFYNRCDRLICPCCQPRLVAQRKTEVEWWTQLVKQPKHLVLTTRNTTTLTRDHVTAFKDAFRRLRRMKVCSGWRGGFWALEVTNRGAGWHLHMHILVDADWLPKEALSVAWSRANRGTGDRIKVKDVRESGYLREVSKYVASGVEVAAWPPSEVAQFALAFEDCRTFGTFGSLFGRRAEWREFLDGLDAAASLCECGSNNVRILSTNELEALDCRPPPVCAPPRRSQPQPELALTLPAFIYY